MACSLCMSMFAASALNGSDPSNRTIFSVSSLISRDNLLYLKKTICNCNKEHNFNADILLCVVLSLLYVKASQDFVFPAAVVDFPCYEINFLEQLLLMKF